MVKNTFKYDPKELDTQIAITKTKLEFAKQNKNSMSVDDLHSLLNTLVEIKNTVVYYSAQPKNMR